MIARDEARTVGLGAWIGTVLVGAFLAGAFVASQEEQPRIGRVRLEALAVEHIESAVREDGPSAESTAERTRAWAVRLEAALQRVAEERGVVLLPAQAVAAGAPDYTGEVRRRLHETAPGDGP